MTRTVAGPMTHRHEGELVVFHIGMQINQWWRPDLWMPVFGAMPRMLRELSIDGDSGLLGYELLLGAGGPYVVQYWSSIDKLYAYASSPSQEHRRVDPIQQDGPQGARRRGNLARDVPRRTGREHLRIDQAHGSSEGHGACAGGPWPRSS
jgi:Domain of unknown function (DUF4188)